MHLRQSFRGTVRQELPGVFQSRRGTQKRTVSGMDNSTLGRALLQGWGHDAHA